MEQSQPKRLELSAEELAKVNKARAKHETFKIDPEQLVIAEFGKHYGWAGVTAVLNNEISGEQMTWLLEGARRVDKGYLYDQARASLIGSVASQSKKIGDTFKKLTKDILKAMKADE